MNEHIRALGQWLSTFPYENITKRDRGQPRGPIEMREEADSFGAGGTCFSLVNLAARRARQEFNLNPRYYLGDRPRGENRHCVLGFPDYGVFLDPGYLCYGPLPLDPDPTFRLLRPQNILHLKTTEKNRLRVETERKGQLTRRYTLKTEPVSRDRFERAWKDSFQWDSFDDSYVMTRQREKDMLLYLNGRLECITRDKRRVLTPPQGVTDRDFLADCFKLGPRLIEKANLSISQ